MVKLRFKNFQSIADGEVEVDGLTVLAGPSNSGKTAVVRAYRGVFNNSPSRALVRRGEKNLEVEVEYDDGQKIVWRKGKGVNEYVVNGKEISGGQTCPDEVREVGGTFPIQAGTNSIWPQIASQEDGMLFLTHLPGSALADAISDVERVGALNRALKSAEKDRRAADATLKVRRKDLDEIKEDVAFFSGLSMIETLLEEIEADRLKSRKIEAAINWFSNWIEAYEEAGEVHRLLEGISLDIPEESEISDARDLWDSYVSAQAEEQRVREIFSEIEELEDLLPNLQSGVDAINVDSIDRAIEKVNSAIEKIGPVVTILPDMERLSDFLEGFPDEFIEVPDLSKVERGMDKLVEYESVLAALLAAQEQVEELTTEYEDVTDRHQQAVDQVSELLGELEECPVCGTPHGPSEGHLD